MGPSQRRSLQSFATVLASVSASVLVSLSAGGHVGWYLLPVAVLLAAALWLLASLIFRWPPIRLPALELEMLEADKYTGEPPRWDADVVVVNGNRGDAEFTAEVAAGSITPVKWQGAVKPYPPSDEVIAWNSEAFPLKRRLPPKARARVHVFLYCAADDDGLGKLRIVTPQAGEGSRPQLELEPQATSVSFRLLLNDLTNECRAGEWNLTATINPKVSPPISVSIADPNA